MILLPWPNQRSPNSDFWSPITFESQAHVEITGPQKGQKWIAELPGIHIDSHGSSINHGSGIYQERWYFSHGYVSIRFDTFRTRLAVFHGNPSCRCTNTRPAKLECLNVVLCLHIWGRVVLRPLIPRTEKMTKCSIFEITFLGPCPVFSFRVKGFLFEGGVKKPTGGRLFGKFHLTHLCALRLSYPKRREESTSMVHVWVI